RDWGSVLKIGRKIFVALAKPRDSLLMPDSLPWLPLLHHCSSCAIRFAHDLVRAIIWRSLSTPRSRPVKLVTLKDFIEKLDKVSWRILPASALITKFPRDPRSGCPQANG